MTAVGDYLASAAQPALGDGGAAPAAYDELVAPDGSVRPAWRGLAPRLATLDAADLARLRSDVDGHVQDDGVTYHRPSGTDAPPTAERWRLDPLPVVLGQSEWAALEVGLVQRAELLEAVLEDLYGAQRLLSRGVLPPELVLGHREFVRAAVGPPAVARRLVLAATDLGRAPDGSWQVLADRTQAPSGAGYALENRRIVARAMPELFREAGLQRLGPWFSAMRAALLAAAPDGPDGARVVVMSPGPDSETSFDQAFLASTLGFPLVEGGDLVVREGAVWMRVLGGLERVDVLVRRVDTAWSDPLEMRADSRLGVPGLTEAARRGTVVVVNGLGSGVLENPGLLPFLPSVCSDVLGEELRLPSVPTWWCGDPSGLSHVLAHLDDLWVRPISRADGAGTAPSLLDAAARDDLVRRLRAEPHAFVGQEAADLSQAPGVRGDALVPGAFSLRTFVVAQGRGYAPMLGALGRVGEPDDPHGSASKDVWVLGEHGQATEPAGGDEGTAYPVAAPAAMVPRLLEDMFWAGRYAERAEDLLRLLLATHAVAEDVRARDGDRASSAALRTLLAALTHVSTTYPGLLERDADVRREVRALLVDAALPGTVAHAVSGLQHAAQGVRDQLSSDVWLVLGGVDRALATARADRRGSVGVLAREASQCLAGLLALAGVTGENMVRDAGWHLLDVGRGVERARQLVALLRATLVEPGAGAERTVVGAVLAATESILTYRRRYRGTASVAAVLDLLVLDRENPRSVAFSLARVGASLSAVPGATGGSRPARVLDGVVDELERADLVRLARRGAHGRADLDQFLGVLGSRLDDLADAVAAHHFSTQQVPRSYGEMRATDGRDRA
ncbi:circularly permuted type 2 ATP-grasp protein [Solicola sp. PLA-1-18]|uniref:circularly permuted type 2 ATP-grasp protein n=1 Tax=Solicola sp. PLA-1-18 TaxID=3380532 RepID=UPI003B789A5B